jgi:TonB family protein
MKYIYFPIFVLFFASCSVYQPNMGNSLKYEAYYADKIENDSKVLRAGYNFVTTQNQNGEYVYSTFYPETKILLQKITYKNKEMTIPIGNYKEFHWETGKIAVEGQFDAFGGKNGEWKRFNAKNGSTVEIANFENDLKEGLVTSFFDKTATVFMKSNYEKGKLDGETLIFDTLGILVQKDIYKEGKLENQLYLDKNRDPKNFTFKEYPAYYYAPECGEYAASEAFVKCVTNATMKYIFTSVKYPAAMREVGMQGRSVIGFVVEKDGSISNVKPIKGIGKALDDEAIRVIKEMPNWKAGMQGGKPARCSFTMPISFTLEGSSIEPFIPKKRFSY